MPPHITHPFIVRFIFKNLYKDNRCPCILHILYFLTVLVTAHNKGEDRTRLLVSLHRGMSFGVRGISLWGNTFINVNRLLIMMDW